MQNLPRLRILAGYWLRCLGGGEELRTPLARLGLSHKVCSAVMMPSRPNGVLNQGTPA
jgi:hypothetical protein